MEFTVNSTVDEPDAAPGDGLCQTASSVCSLRAGIDETNAQLGDDRLTLRMGEYLIDGRVPRADGTFPPSAQRRTLAIRDGLTIQGPGPQYVTLNGQHRVSVMRIENVDALVVDPRDNMVRRFPPGGGTRSETLVGPASGGLSGAGAAAIVGNDLFVVGFVSGLHRYDANTGVFRNTVASLADHGPFVDVKAPHPILDSGVATGLYLAEYRPGGQVLRVNPVTGVIRGRLTPRGSGPVSLPNSVAFRGSKVYITDAGSGEVLRHNGTSGAFEAVLVRRGAGGLRTPRGLVFYGASLYVASDESDAVLEYNADTGAFQRALIPSGSGGLVRPTQLALAPDGDLLVTSAGTRKILRYDAKTGAPKGTFAAAGPETGTYPMSVVFRRERRNGPVVELSGLTIANGQADVGDSGGLTVGAGVRATLTESVVRDNASSIFGGGISSFGHLTVRRSELRNNRLALDVLGGFTSSGGGIWAQGILVVEDSAIIGNSAVRGGGINANAATVDIRNTTISGNEAQGGGGGIRAVGFRGDGRTVLTRVSISHSTISNNSANLTLDSDEFTKFGGGIQVLNDAMVTLGNSIVAGNHDRRTSSDADFSPDCHSTGSLDVRVRGGNLIGILTNNCGVPAARAAETLHGTPAAPLNAGLAALSENGGPTRTHALLLTSPAIDAATSVPGAESFYGCMAADQRGLPRPFDGNDDGTLGCDIGALEQQPDDDLDGVASDVEDAAPNSGDGNGDGVPDRVQPSVASLPNARTGEFVTFLSRAGSGFRNMRAETRTAPPGFTLPYGSFSFDVVGLAETRVNIILPAGAAPTTYYKFGRTPDNATAHWYEFRTSGGTGASISGNRVNMTFRDGARGDDDLTVNGVIHDPGGPAQPTR
jgi:CSLREA domain-containing protein